MAVKAFQTIRDRVRRVTRDYAGTRWSDTELDGYINNAQAAYCYRTRTLEVSYEVTYEGTDIFILPKDYIEALRFELPEDGKTLPIISWKILAEKYGATFLEHRNSEVYHLYFDYESWNRFRFYPNPDMELGTVMGTLHYYRYPEQDVIEIEDIEALVYYALFCCYLKESDQGQRAKAIKYYKEFDMKIVKDTKYLDKHVLPRKTARMF